MKASRPKVILVGIAAALTLAFGGYLAVLANGGHLLPWATQTDGGGAAASTGHELRGSLEHVVGTAESPNFIIEAGFWPGEQYLQALGGSTPTTVAVMPLVTGLNFIAQPREPQTPYTASSLAVEIASQGGTLDQIDVWNENLGQWQSHKVGLPFNDFTLEMDRSYFLKITQGTIWLISGQALSQSVQLDLVTGLNGIGIPYSDTSYTASTLASAIAAQGGALDQIDVWDENLGQWQSHKVGLPFNDFSVAPWRGYFLRALAGSTFQP